MAKNDPDLAYLLGLKPKQAIAYLKSKGYAMSWDWQDIWAESHAKAFTVAKAMRMDVLTDIRGAVTEALENGQTLAEFKKGLEPKLKAKGWWGRQMVGDGTGGAAEVQLGSPWRLANIYRTNLSTAHAAGRYKTQMENVDHRPYWMRVEVMDQNTRETHRALNGLVFPADDPFWNSHYPPDAWGCRGRVRALTAKQVEARGIKPQSSAGRMSQKMTLISGRTGEMRPVTVYTAPNGMKIPTDPGWDYNPGREWLFPDLDRYDTGLARQFVTANMSGPTLERFMAGKAQGNLPVAVLDDDLAKAVKAETKVVHLSGDSLVKNIEHHPDLQAADYRRLPEIIQAADLVVQDGERTLVFLKEGDRMYFGAIKATGSGRGLFLTSFRLSNKSEAARLMKKGRVLRGKLD